MDTLERFPRVWCPTCGKTQPMIFDVLKADEKNDHDAADIVCGHANQSSRRCTLRRLSGRARAPRRRRKRENWRAGIAPSE